MTAVVTKYDKVRSKTFKIFKIIPNLVSNYCQSLRDKLFEYFDTNELVPILLLIIQKWLMRYADKVEVLTNYVNYVIEIYLL